MDNNFLFFNFDKNSFFNGELYNHYLNFTLNELLEQYKYLSSLTFKTFEDMIRLYNTWLALGNNFNSN